jgi:hypothetical protein
MERFVEEGDGSWGNWRKSMKLEENSQKFTENWNLKARKLKKINKNCKKSTKNQTNWNKNSKNQANFKSNHKSPSDFPTHHLPQSQNLSLFLLTKTSHGNFELVDFPPNKNFANFNESTESFHISSLIEILVFGHSKPPNKLHRTPPLQNSSESDIIPHTQMRLKALKLHNEKLFSFFFNCRRDGKGNKWKL